MAIGADLQARYATECDVDWVDCLAITHPAIAPLYLCNSPDAIQGDLGDGLVTFTPVPFQISLPARDNNGRQDMSLVLSNVGSVGQAVLEQAVTQPAEPIQVSFTVFIRGDTSPQIDPPLTLSMTDIVVTTTTITATITRSDILNLPFPRQVYRPDWFPGLDRR